MQNLTDRQHEFLMSEYETLRNEIENSKDRVFKIVAGEAILIPAVSFLIKLGKEEYPSGTIGSIYLVMPFLVLVFVSQFLYENNCIYRAGFYIRSYIEPFYSEKNTDYPYLGWEEWLEEWLDAEASSGSRKWWKRCISFTNEYVFSWTKIPGADNRILKKFLGKSYNVDWVYNAIIAKSEDGKTINISKEDTTHSLTLNNENSEVILRIDNKETDKFIAKNENGELRIYTDKNCVSKLKNYVSKHFTTSKPHRSVDKYVKYSFYLLSAVYYFAIVSLAWNHISSELNDANGKSSPFLDQILAWNPMSTELTNSRFYLLIIYGLLFIFMALKIGANAWTNTFMKDFLRKDINTEDVIILDKAIKICPKDSELWKRKGDIFIKSNDVQDGINAYDRAIELNPRDALAWSCKGDALERNNKHEAANEAYDNALELDQSFASAWAGKHKALKALGRVAESDVALSKSRELCGID